MQHEIATAQSDLGAVEEKVLERMLEADAIAADAKRAEAALAARQKEIDAEKKDARAGAHLGGSVADARPPRHARRSSRIWSRA